MALVFGYIRSWELSEEILSNVKNPRESVQLIIFLFRHILITNQFVSALGKILIFDLRENVFFISCGTVRIVHAKTRAHTLTDGAFFGKISLILPNLRRV